MGECRSLYSIFCGFSFGKTLTKMGFFENGMVPLYTCILLFVLSLSLKKLLVVVRERLPLFLFIAYLLNSLRVAFEFSAVFIDLAFNVIGDKIKLSLLNLSMFYPKTSWVLVKLF